MAQTPIEANVMPKRLMVVWLTIVALTFFAIAYWPGHQKVIANGFIGVVLITMGIFAVMAPLLFARKIEATEWVSKNIYPFPPRTRFLGLILIAGAALLFWLAVKA
jgi:hypothetical protein